MTGPKLWPPDLASPDTELGQLQRGHGSIARAILQRESGDARAMVLACVEHDPRWDSQLDSRADYYARLVPVVDLAAGDLVRLVEASESDAPVADPGASLALGVLFRLAAYRDAQAVEATRRYVAWGRYWPQAIQHLVYAGWGDKPIAGWRERVEGLATVICARWPTPETMTAVIQGESVVDRRRLPWSRWTEEHGLIGAVLDAEASRLEAVTYPREQVRGRSTGELLALDGLGYLRPVAQKLAKRTAPADVAAMLAAARDPEAPMRAAAVSGLARQQRVEALPTVLELFGSGSHPARSLMYRAFCDLPYEDTRPTAIEWLGGGDMYRKTAAASAMERHALAEDVRLVRQQLTAELDSGLEGEQYLVCSFAGALGRHPALGPYEELDRAYRQMPYSYGRRFVVDALAGTDPTFPRGIAVDCLWDAESAIRATAAKVVDRAQPVAALRLAELQGDPQESPEVRTAAA